MGEVHCSIPVGTRSSHQDSCDYGDAPDGKGSSTRENEFGVLGDFVVNKIQHEHVDCVTSTPAVAVVFISTNKSDGISDVEVIVKVNGRKLEEEGWTEAVTREELYCPYLSSRDIVKIS